MSRLILRTAALALVALALPLPRIAAAQELVLKDPTGDDDGPGKYVYPTDPVYKPGSFDLSELRVSAEGEKVTFAVTVGSELENPWSMPARFSIQLVFIHVNTGKGALTKGVPGTNVQFAKGEGYDRIVVLAPQPADRVKTEFTTKAPDLAKAAVIPADTTASGKTITATVDRKALGAGDPAAWGYQVVMQSNEGFPDKKDVLTRKVNEYEGQHRFGGGHDGECDPHAMDVLAGKAAGEKDEVEAQHQMLSYECNPDGTPKKLATLKLVRKERTRK